MQKAQTTDVLIGRLRTPAVNMASESHENLWQRAHSWYMHRCSEQQPSQLAAPLADRCCRPVGLVEQARGSGHVHGAAVQVEELAVAGGAAAAPPRPRHHPVAQGLASDLDGTGGRRRRGCSRGPPRTPSCRAVCSVSQGTPICTCCDRFLGFGLEPRPTGRRHTAALSIKRLLVAVGLIWQFLLSRACRTAVNTSGLTVGVAAAAPRQALLALLVDHGCAAAVLRRANILRSSQPRAGVSPATPAADAAAWPQRL